MRYCNKQASERCVGAADETRACLGPPFRLLEACFDSPRMDDVSQGEFNANLPSHFVVAKGIFDFAKAVRNELNHSQMLYKPE